MIIPRLNTTLNVGFLKIGFAGLVANRQSRADAPRDQMPHNPAMQGTVTSGALLAWFCP